MNSSARSKVLISTNHIEHLVCIGSGICQSKAFRCDMIVMSKRYPGHVHFSKSGPGGVACPSLARPTFASVDLFGEARLIEAVDLYTSDRVRGLTP